MTDNDKFTLLKDLLFKEDRVIAEKIMQKLDKVEEVIYVEENFSDKVNPIIDQKIDTFVTKIPVTLGPIITETLANEVKNSQDVIVEALFPIIGKMIKKYIQQEFTKLSDTINGKVNNAFSIKSYKRQLKSIITGIPVSQLIVSEMAKPTLQQIFIIEKGSGIILGSYTRNETIDEDMIAGMLTAIKSFVEDAFNGGNQSLENIEYEFYTIQIQNFSSYYMAAVLSGSISNYFKSKIQDQMFEFAEKHISNLEQASQLTNKLEAHFKND